MLQQLHHAEIDFDRWDQMVLNSDNSSLYGMSWFLNAWGDWSAVILDGYKGGMAFFTSHKKPVFTEITQAPFVQRYIWFGTPVDPSDLWDFFKGLADRLHFNTDRLLDAEQGQQRLNLFLPLDRPYDEIASGYHKTLAKNIRRAKRGGLSVRYVNDPLNAIHLYKERYGALNPQLKAAHYETLARLASDNLDKGRSLILEASLGEEVLAACIFLVHDQRMHYVLGAPNAAGRRWNALSLLLDQLIQDHANSPAILDFEGSSIPAVGAFYRSFGAKEEYFYEMQNTAHPFLRVAYALKQLSKFKR